MPDTAGWEGPRGQLPDVDPVGPFGKCQRLFSEVSGTGEFLDVETEKSRVEALLEQPGGFGSASAEEHPILVTNLTKTFPVGNGSDKV